MEIRLYQEQDYEGLCRLCQGVSEYYAVRKIPGMDETREYVRKYMLDKDQGTRIALAFAQGEPVGMVTFYIMYPSPNLKGQLYMKELYVDGHYRGKGAGRELMQFVANYALEHDCNRMDWTAEKTNPSALTFYQAVGGEPLEKKIYYRLEDKALEDFAGNNG